MPCRKKITFVADEGFQAVILDLVGKDHITANDFNNLVKGLLLRAHSSANGQPVLIYKKIALVCTDPLTLTSPRPLLDARLCKST